MAAVDRMLETVPEADSSLLLHLGNFILPALPRGSVFDCFRSKEPFQAAPFHGDSFRELLILICCCSAMSESLWPHGLAAHFAVLHYFPEFAQSHAHWVSDAIQLILNVMAPFLPSCGGFSFALGHGVSFLGGFQHSPVGDCSAASCNFGFLTGRDKCMSFYSTILEWLSTDQSLRSYSQLQDTLACQSPEQNISVRNFK